jgi:AraC family transcriptional regulator, transcriptional activator of pobA
MLNQSAFTLINPQNGNPAFKIFPFEDNSYFEKLQRNNFFTLIWVMNGSGKVNANFNEFEFDGNSLFAFSPYQPYTFTADKPVNGIAIYFHFDFFCIHKHQKELEVNGVLYNNAYQLPFVRVDEEAAATFKLLCEQIKTEMQVPALAQHELLVAYLKIFLITATRLKIQQQPQAAEMTKDNKEPFILQKLKDAIEENYKTRHSASDYAGLLYISPKALAKITKTHFNKTLSSLINERIIIEAKRELYLTNKTVKEIAYELGYEDEYYFSRFFKVNADVSPQMYRDTVGFGRAELVSDY